MNKLEEFNKKQLKEIPELRPGYTIRVHQKIKEGDKQRIQVFEGLIIAVKHGKGVNGTITVRRSQNGYGVERVFPIHAPFIEKFEVVKKSKVRRAKLYYIRKKSAKESRLTEIRETKETVPQPEPETKIEEKPEK
jgi:large subunit ribosomal protein L19